MSKKSVDEILYHLYESGENSKYIRADHIGKPLTPDQAKAELAQLLLEEMPKKKVGERVLIPCPDNKPGCLVAHYGQTPTCEAFNRAIDQVADKIKAIFGVGEGDE